MEGGRRPGRPKGDGTNDDAELAAMADLILANPGLRPTTAYKRVVHRPGDTAIRRIQAKWRERREALLAAAGDRRDRARELTAIGPCAARTARFERATEAAERRMDEMLGGFGSGLGRELSTMRALRDAVDPPALRELRRIMDNPLAKAMRSLEDSTGARAMRRGVGHLGHPHDARSARFRGQRGDACGQGIGGGHALSRDTRAGQGDARPDGWLTTRRRAEIYSPRR